MVAGTAGTPRYGWTGTGETDRNFAGGPGSGTTVVGDAKTKTGPYVSELDFSETFETVDWSQARYADYGFVALDVTPAAYRPADHHGAPIHQRAGPGARPGRLSPDSGANPGEPISHNWTVKLPSYFECY